MRRHMLAQWERFIMLPLGVVSLSVWVGVNTDKSLGWIPVAAIINWRTVLAILRGYTPPNFAFVLLVLTYYAWNAWHFGSQNFGVASLAGWLPGRRRLRQVLTVAPTVVCTTVPILSEIVSLGHWLTDIGLSALKVRRWWLFIGVILAVGAIGFIWKEATPHGTALYSIPVLISSRCGLGLVHFLYSRWCWRRDSPILAEP